MLTTLLGASAVYVVAESVDLRKSIDGLALAVATSLGASPLSGSVYVFFNRGRGKVKLLWWDRHGFWLACKRLEKGRSLAPLRCWHRAPRSAARLVQVPRQRPESTSTKPMATRSVRDDANS
ncbi:IS66 family insertion sequence element accessory protein TnpB [Methyloterricola oryzae]|uniref:IS66 family insertion sequence element accessory protein TnpB n=1 Tax=Methyloterricola oryzae TaxID=1495050 RepID=UPI0009E5B752|nr:IS66 family insertion sequence element accessory protein TnpB [Methyloterricola oryzae]